MEIKGFLGLIPKCEFHRLAYCLTYSTYIIKLFQAKCIQIAYIKIIPEYMYANRNVSYTYVVYY